MIDPGVEGVRGGVAEGFEAVAEAMATNVAEHGEIGAAVCAHADGELVVDLWTGTADLDRSRPWEPDTLVNLYSVGKGIVSVLVLQLVDEGRIGLDDRVADHWDAFGAAGKESVTVRQVLCHRAGVPAIRHRIAPEDVFDFDAMARAVAATAPWWEPGTRHAYHTNTFGHLTGGLLRAVTGHGPGTLLAERIAGPLGADVHFGVPTEVLERCADVHWAGGSLTIDWEAIERGDSGLDHDQLFTMLGYANPPGYASMGVVNTTEWRQSEIPSTSGHGSARGVAAVYEALRSGSLVSAELLSEAATPQSEGWCPTLGQEVTFGLGFQPWTPNRPIGRTPGSIGHFGTGGSLGFVDPARRVSFGYVMNHVIPRWQSPRNRNLVDALYAAL